MSEDDAGGVKIDAKLRNTTGTPLSGELRLAAGEARPEPWQTRSSISSTVALPPRRP